MKKDVITDTSDFFSIGMGDIVNIGGRNYEVLGHARELRFGIEDPKFWVKRVIDTENGEKKNHKTFIFRNIRDQFGWCEDPVFQES